MYPPSGPFAKPPEKAKSYWFWWVCFGFGMASCVGFLIAAFKIQTRKFIAAAVIAVIASTATFAAVSLDPSFDTASTTDAESTQVTEIGFGFWVAVIVWAALVVYALILQPEVKRFLEAQDAAAYARWNAARTQVAYAPPFQPPAPRAAPQPPPPKPSPDPEDPLGAQADRYLAQQPGGNVPPLTPPNVPAAAD